MTVDVTYCLSEWEEYFTEKPLSFNEFVDTYQYKATIYPHILKTIDEVSKQPSKLEYFIQGCLGSGKSTLIYLLAAYKVYLHLILKSARDLYGFSPSAELSMIIYSPTKKSADFTVGALMQVLSGLPFFKKVRYVSECFDCKDVAIYTTAYPNSLLTFKKGDNVLHVVDAKEESDLIGRNPVIGIMNELGHFKEQGVSIEKIFNFYQKLHWRIDSRCKGLFSAVIVEKNPGNYWDDILDQIIYENRDPSKMIIFFHRYWEIFKDKDPDAELDSTFNITTCSVVEHGDGIYPGDTFVKFPSTFQGADFLRMARENPENFIKDYVGMPVMVKHHSLTYGIMKDIVSKIHDNNLEICFKNGKAYLECPREELSIDLSDYSE